MRILVIDDEKEICQFLKKSLEDELFAVDVAYDGEEGSFLARTNDYDLVVLDISLPKKAGSIVCREIRETGKTTPIIMLTASAETASKIEFFKKGVDDYLTKPFSFEELLARIKAILRRSHKIENNVFRIGNLVFDKEKNNVFRGEKEIRLTRKEYMLLEYLMKNAGKVLSRGMIMEHVWDISCDPFSNTVEAHVHNLRRKINIVGEKELIKTISGRGYKIEG